MNAGQRHLVVMVRKPRLGRVKSRLAADIGAVWAWRFYRLAMAAQLRRLGADGRWTCWLSVTPDEDACPALWPRPWRPMAQGGGGLGARMLRPFRQLPPGPVVVVGSDIPSLGPAVIWRAFRALGNHDLVFGPAEDGGFYLVGAKRCPRLPGDLFDGVVWSRPTTLSQTLAKLGGQRVAMVDRLWDVDGVADYCRWKRLGVSPDRPDRP